MQENNTKRWSVGLKFVQWEVNISRHETTGHSPFKVTFGQDPQVGLGSSVLPKHALCEITTEEELETFVAECKTVMEAVSATAERDEETATGTEAETVMEAVSMTAEREEETATELEEEFETHIESFHEVRVTADKGL